MRSTSVAFGLDAAAGSRAVVSPVSPLLLGLTTIPTLLLGIEKRTG